MTWPMRVLKAKDVMVAMETPLERVRVSKISAGIIQDRGPQVAEKEKLYSQVLESSDDCGTLYDLNLHDNETPRRGSVVVCPGRELGNQYTSNKEANLVERFC